MQNVSTLNSHNCNGHGALKLDGLTDPTSAALVRPNKEDQDAPARQHDKLSQPPLSRDPHDVETIYKLTWLATLLAFFLFATIGAAFYLFHRDPDLIVIDNTTGQRLVLNNREVSSTPNVRVGKDRLTDNDKKYVAGEFIKAVYNINPVTREADLARAMEMMLPSRAEQFSDWLKQQGVLRREKQEGYQATWTPQVVEVDPRDPLAVRIIGEQQLTKFPGGVMQRENVQYNLIVRLKPDRAKRDPRNLNSGFIVVEYTGDTVKPAS